MSRIISGKIRLDVQRVDLADGRQGRHRNGPPGRRGQGHSPAARPRSARRPGHRRSRTAAAGVLEPAHQRHQVHARRAARCRSLLERVNSHVEVSVTDTGEGIDRRVPAATSSTASARPMPPPPAGTAAWGSAWRSSSSLSNCTAAPFASKAAATASARRLSSVCPLPPCYDAAAPERPAPATPLTQESRHPARVSDSAEVRVLVVDDEPDARGWSNDCSSKPGRPSDAGSARRPSRVLHERPNVLVSDIGMPGEDGYAFIRRIRALEDGHRQRSPPSHHGLRAVRRPHQRHSPASTITWPSPSNRQN